MNKKGYVILLIILLGGSIVNIYYHKHMVITKYSSLNKKIINQLNVDTCFLKHKTLLYNIFQKDENFNDSRKIILHIFDIGCNQCIEKQIKICKNIITHKINPKDIIWFITSINKREYNLFIRRNNLKGTCIYIPPQDKLSCIDTTLNSYFITVNNKFKVIHFNYIDNFSFN